VLERFGQIEPKVLFCADGYRYNGQEHDTLERVREIVERLPTLRKAVVIPAWTSTSTCRTCRKR